MKLRVVILFSTLLLIAGCGGSGASGASASASPTPKGGAKVAEGKPAPKKPQAQAKRGSGPGKDAGNAKTLEEAEAAFADGRYREAAVITQNSLDVLRSEEAPRDQIIKTMDYLATCQVKAQMYEKACGTYTNLAKASPGNDSYKKALNDTKKLYWDNVLAPKLAEAERLRDKKHYSSAIGMAEEVKDDAVKVSLSTEPVDKVLASIRKLQSQASARNSKGANNTQMAHAGTPKQVAAPRPPVKVQATMQLDSESSYPSSKGGRPAPPRRRGR